jgi:DNA-binding Xre family transcriptional regulator
MRKAILAKTTIVSEGTLRAICEKFEIRYNTIIEYVK